MTEEQPSVPRIPVPRTLINASQKDVYDGADLRPYVGREGALDFLNLPSRNGRKLTYRKDAKRQQGEVT